MAVDQRTRVTGTALLLFFLSLFLTAYSSKHPKLASTGSAVAAEIARPLEFFVVSTSSWLGGLWDNYIGLVGLRDEYNTLIERVKILEQDKYKLLELEQENDRLRKLLNAGVDGNFEVVAARINGYDHSNWVHAISIDKGLRDGLATGMAAITAEGVVGQTVAVGLTTSRVLLITDHSSGVDAMIQNNRARGIVEGAGQRSLSWRFVLQDEEIKIGDRLITSGMDGIFPPGLFIGRISEVEPVDSGLFKSIIATPAVEFSKIENILIITGVKEVPQKHEEIRKK